MQDAAQNRYIALPLRDHTILGVCEAIGEDFGFNPTWIRVPLAASVLYSFQFALAAYLVLGVAVLASRLLFPHPRNEAAASAPVAEYPTAKPADSHDELPLAA